MNTEPSLTANAKNPGERPEPVERSQPQPSPVKGL